MGQPRGLAGLLAHQLHQVTELEGPVSRPLLPRSRFSRRERHLPKAHMFNPDPSAASDLAAASRSLRRIARDAALKVAPPLLAAFRSRMAIDYKVDLHDPVTEFDRQSEATIREHIMAAAPDSVIIGEEGGTAGAGNVCPSRVHVLRG